MDSERLEKQFSFIKEIDKAKQIKRQTYKSDGITKENDAEHSWHLAVMAILLCEYSNKEIDVLKTVTMLLIHDMVEIYAGDTYAYDEEGKKTQRQREINAADKIFGLLPSDQQNKLRGLWDEFEEGTTPEAQFAHTMDNVQPCMLNALTGGKMWAKKGIAVSQVLERNKNTSDGSRALWEYSYNNFILPNLACGNLKNDIQS